MLVLLYGKESLLLRRRARELKKQALAKGAAVVEVDCGHEEAAEAFSELGTPSLFAVPRIFFFHEPFGLPSFADKEAHSAFLQSPHTLVFLAQELKKTDPLARFLLRHAQVEEFACLEGARLKAWLAKECEQQGLELAPQAAGLLLFACADSAERLASEVAKLAAFKRFSSRKLATEQDVLLLVARRTEPKIFATIEAIAAKNRREAGKLLAEHLEAGEAPLQLLGMFAWHTRTLLSIKALGEQGFSPKEIAGKLKIHPFVAQKGVGAAQRFSLEELKNLHRRIFALDLAFKTGRGNPGQLLHLFVAQACSQENQRV